MEHAICCFFSLIIEGVILWQYACSLFSPKQARAGKRAAVLCVFFVLLFAVSLFSIAWLNTVSYLLVCFVFLYTQYQLRWHLACFHCTVLTSVMSLCELAAYGMVEHFMPRFYTHAPDFYNLILLAVFSKLLFFVIICLLMHALKFRREDAQQYDHSVLLLVSVPLASLFVMLTFFHIGYRYPLSFDLLEMITFSAVCLLITTLLAFGANQYNQKKSAEFTNMQLLLQKEANAAEYYKMLASQNENQSILIHDIKEHLQSIDMLNDKKDHERIRAYIHCLLHSSDLKEYAQLCGNEMLNTILCRYKRQCDGEGIAFHADIRCKTIDFMADSDLTSLFCNLLDNAIEAAGHTPGSFIEVDAIRRNERTPLTVITVRNSCRINPFTGPGKTLDTKKPDRRRHGFGIKSIQKTIRKYHGDIQMYYNEDTYSFHTIIMLKETAGRH